MQNDAELNALGEQMRAWRRDIHQHPELGFQEHRTAGLVAKLLTDWAIDVHTGIGGTGVVGTIRGTGGPGPSLGLRADMDALPMTEKGSVEHRSTHDNIFHGCGHDGHTAILLGVAKHLASHRTFCGTVHLIFQPAEETLRGGSEMIRDGLFERFPCDEIYALHNNNALPAGKIGVRAGAILSACDLFRISIKGIGSHAAMPHKSIDPLIVGTTVVQSIQSIVSRNIDPLDTAVVSVCKFIAGTAINVIADTAVLEGTVRTLSVAAQELTLARLRDICEGAAKMYGCEVRFEHLQSSPPTVNTVDETEFVRRAAVRVLGAENVIVDVAPLMASEDFAFMLQQRPGSYFFLGHGGLTCHHPEFDFDDDTLPTGAAVFIEIVRQRLG
ncbi:Hippurate hydrolase [Paraburkholderia nemoris]|uniref:Hippurate hydrolase n=2 Tax=Paraburkholderia nemoris TaxID=2793076 RepID=A0ABM8QXL8_9BURK|nr:MULTISPECIES: M20 aminoacylase family protein [Paraburkholderia]MBK5148770.1 amidohydrolase [Burkholderia sp. R-69608]CAE6721298.1 Hippurate hydrolase [Paraburkholderia nemoris]CAE6723881.1 Hippurate hydrolase [Paraburkholderia nemoris]CAE6909466.1 Hippurate hydrolase [Paraburkholderia nemoris]